MKLPEHLLIFSKHRTSALAFYHIVNPQYTPDGYHLRDTWLVLLSVQPHRRVSINFIAGGIESMLVLEMFPSLCLHWSEQIGELLTKSQSVRVLPHITPRVNGRVQQGRKWLSSNQDNNTHTTDSFLPQGTKSEFCVYWFVKGAIIFFSFAGVERSSYLDSSVCSQKIGFFQIQYN